MLQKSQVIQVLDDMIAEMNPEGFIPSNQDIRYSHKLEVVKERILALPEESEWVPVSERLPSAEGRYMVFGKPYEEAEESVSFSEFSLGVGFYSLFMNQIRKNIFITHWKPLPLNP